jgi:uncharacterized membrane protein YphA (DoxX/SURF4 family)
MNAWTLFSAWRDDVTAGWNRFWFQPTAPHTLALMRILTGAMLFYTHLVWSLDLEAFFGPRSWVTPETLEIVRPGSYAWSFFPLIDRFDSPALLWTTHIAALVVFLAFTLGLFTRVTAVLSFLLAVSYAHRGLGAQFGLDQINTMLALYLMLAPCGACYSVDAWLRRRRTGKAIEPPESVAANIAVRLIQIHMCVIYMYAGMGKLTGETWWNGTAIWQSFAKLEYQSLDMTWMADWPLLVALLGHVTVFWELYYCALVWPRATRPIVVALSVPMHMGIAVCMGMITFGLIMIVANLAFVPPWLTRALIERKREQGRGGAPDGGQN